MRVYFTDGQFTDFPTAEKWESCGDNWVELTDEYNCIVVVLNWNHVYYMEPMSE